MDTIIHPMCDKDEKASSFFRFISLKPITAPINTLSNPRGKTVEVMGLQMEERRRVGPSFCNVSNRKTSHHPREFATNGTHQKKGPAPNFTVNPRPTPRIP